MYTQNLNEAKDNAQLLRDALDDFWTWDANNGDILNEELGKITEILDGIDHKIKTI